VLRNFSAPTYSVVSPIANTSELDQLPIHLRWVSWIVFSRSQHCTDISRVLADFDGFLPAATERHHQLLLPALQLVVGTLVSFGPETTVAARQAHAFIAGQRENLLIALKDCSTTQNVALMREAHLIVTLLGIILPTISDDELVSLAMSSVCSTLTILSFDPDDVLCFRWSTFCSRRSLGEDLRTSRFHCFDHSLERPRARRRSNTRPRPT